MTKVLVSMKIFPELMSFKNIAYEIIQHLIETIIFFSIILSKSSIIRVFVLFD